MASRSSTNTWADPRIVDDPRIDHTDPLLRAAAEKVHANESLHRHDLDGPVCAYCALVAANALAGANLEARRLLALAVDHIPDDCAHRDTIQAAANAAEPLSGHAIDTTGLTEAAELLRAHHMQLVQLTLPGSEAVPIIDDVIRARVLDAAAAHQRGFDAIENTLRAIEDRP